ncbi:hypothetical protein GJ496_003666 [Pomphorhynchus laevis]|nr:hypothetical protein GJ496_003666 [Pomphorhynchus laevis]
MIRVRNHESLRKGKMYGVAINEIDVGVQNNKETTSTNVQRTVEMKKAESLDNNVETVPNVTTADIMLGAENGQEQVVMENMEVHNGLGVETTMGNQSIPLDDQAILTSVRNRRPPVRYDSFF